MIEIDDPTSNKFVFWFAMAFLISLAVRALKAPTPLPPCLQVPSRWRPWLAVALGQLIGVADALATGTPWRKAAIHGLAAAATAVLGHQVVVKSFLEPPASGKPPARRKNELN